MIVTKVNIVLGNLATPLIQTEWETVGLCWELVTIVPTDIFFL